MARKWSTVALSLLLSSPLWAQTTPAAARLALVKTAQSNGEWVSGRSWQMQARCAELHALLEGTIDARMRQAVAKSPAPVAAAKTKIDRFALARRDGGVQVQVKLAGLKPPLASVAEAEANRLMTGSPQGQAVRAFLLQPLAITSLGNGQIAKNAEYRISAEDGTAVVVVLSPIVPANVLGRPVKDFTVRIAKAKKVAEVIRINFVDGSMLQARYFYGEVKAQDGASFMVPVSAELKQKGLTVAGQATPLPETCVVRYEKRQIGAAAHQ